MRQRLAELDRLAASLEPLVRVAEQAEAPGRKGAGTHTWIVAPVLEGLGVVLLRTVEADAPLGVLPRLAQLAAREPGPPLGVVGLEQKRGLSNGFGHADQLVGVAQLGLELCPLVASAPETPQRWNQLAHLARLLAQRSRSCVGLLDLRRAEPSSSLKGGTQRELQRQLLMRAFPRVRQLREQLQTPRQIGDRFQVVPVLLRVFTRQPVVGDGAPGEAGLCKMVREQGGLPVELVGVHLL